MCTIELNQQKNCTVRFVVMVMMNVFVCVCVREREREKMSHEIDFLNAVSVQRTNQ